MPPKARITREMIMNTVLEITRETGFEAVNARGIAGKLQCSTRPIFTCYESMNELKREFNVFAFEFYERYVDHYRHSVQVSPELILPLSYMDFAREETHLFQFLFVDEMDLTMTELRDFYTEIGNEKKAARFSESVGVELEQGKIIFFDLFLYAHGMAVLTAAGKLSFDRDQAEEMLKNVLTAFVRQANLGRHDLV